jgi:hypothetical protein
MRLLRRLWGFLRAIELFLNGGDAGWGGCRCCVKANDAASLLPSAPSCGGWPAILPCRGGGWRTSGATQELKLARVSLGRMELADPAVGYFFLFFVFLLCRSVIPLDGRLAARGIGWFDPPKNVGRFYYLSCFTSELYNLLHITWVFSICHTLHQFFSYLPYLSFYSFINFFNSEIHCEIQYLVLIPGWTKPGPIIFFLKKKKGPIIDQPNW